MQATGRTGRYDCDFRHLRLRPGAFGGQRDKAVELAVESCDPMEIGFGELDRREFASSDEPGRLGEAQERELSHELLSSWQKNRWHEHMRRLVAMRPRLGNTADHPVHMAIGLDQLGHVLRRPNEARLA